uniref:Coiled-coil domain-containing protein 86 n=3 Tax=Panagrolaimus sp. JU765 TaxID=591449 RepID=A0AC34R4H4_9BILA
MESGEIEQKNKKHQVHKTGGKIVKKSKMESGEIEQKNKKHQVHKTGGKIVKKLKQQKKKGTLERGNNLKAFKFQSANRARLAIARAANLSERKIHVPLIDRTPDEPPPLIVAIAGPSKVGKTTLLHSLIRHYVKAPINTIKGPFTLVTGKQRRLTFIEVQNDINSMIDAAKVADLVLLMMDGSYGFEMEAFEMINICQVHGMPRIMGVLSHLDSFKSEVKLRTKKKLMKHRFWTEVYQGAKLFYLSGLLNNLYVPGEIKNLARFISVMKLRPIIWRTTHPYVLVDRYEDLTDREAVKANDRIDRNISLYGWVRGTHLKNNSSVHIPGVGDLKVKSVSALPDPCPLPSQIKRRRLNEKERTIYAPFSGLGGVVYDDDAVYIETGASVFKSKNKDELVQVMEGVQETMGEKINKAPLKLLNGLNPMHMDEDDEKEDDDDDGDFAEDEDDFEDEEELDDEDEELDGDDDVEMKSEDEKEGLLAGEQHKGQWESLAEKAMAQFKRKKRAHVNWYRLVYDEEHNAESDDEDTDLTGGIFKVAKSGGFSGKKAFKDQEDGMCYKDIPTTSKYVVCVGEIFKTKDWTNQEIRDSIRDCFVTGNWDAEDQNNGLDSEDEKQSENGEEEGSDDEDYEDLAAKGDESKKEEKPKKEETKAEAEERRRQMKERLKKQFDAEYDEVKAPYNAIKAEYEDQAQRNKSAFDEMDDETRFKLEGYRPGLYVRIELENIPVEFIDNFNPNNPYIVGGLLHGEQNMGYVQVRIKKHRWYDRILKSRDPLIISCGWRRFQTVAIYSIQDHNMRNRFIKYTPQNIFCNAVLWAPLVAQNTGFLALQSVDERINGYRIAGTGSVMAMDKNIQVVKKLKLVGTPFEIYKNTAFIKGMFNSALEVARFEGSAVRTVSGIRGFIKKATKDHEGGFRASFEDKIKRSDIVFLRSWVHVPLPKFYAAVTDKLLPPDEKWLGMKTVGRLRYELGIKQEDKPDSHYREVERPEFFKKELVIPKKLQKELPYSDKPKPNRTKAKESYLKKKFKKSDIEARHTAIILEPEETKSRQLMKMLTTVSIEQTKKNKQTKEKIHQRRKKAKDEVKDRREKKRKETQAKICRMLSKRDKHKVQTVLKEVIGK